MKHTFMIIAITLSTQLASAHGTHPLVTAYSQTIEAAYDVAIHKAGYVEADFDDLIGQSSLQDDARKVRVVRFRFTTIQCAKDLEVYYSLDGSKHLSHKVVGCVP